MADNGLKPTGTVNAIFGHTLMAEEHEICVENLTKCVVSVPGAIDTDSA